MDENDPRCQYDYLDAIHPLFLIVVPGSQLIFSLLDVVIIIWFLIRFFKKAVFPLNAKILVFSQLTLYFALSIDFLIVYGEHIYNAIFNNDRPCAFFKLANECFVHFYIYVAMVSGSAIMQVSIGIERIVSTIYAKNYAKFNALLGSCLVTATLLLSSFFCIFLLWTYDPLEFRMGCYGLPLSTGSRGAALYSAILICDLLSIILFVIGWRISQQREKETEFSRYQLEENYQRQENGRLMTMFLPNFVIQSICYAGYAISTVMGRSMWVPESNGLLKNLFIRHNSLPILILIELGLIFLFLKRLKNEKKKFKEKLSTSEQDAATDAYFAKLAKQWN